VTYTPSAVGTGTHAIAASYTPTDSVHAASGSIGTSSIAVNPDSTSTSLDVSNPTVNVGGSATDTATITASHPGPAEPSGSVDFLDAGRLIPGCAARALQVAGSALTATCSVAYATAGDHRITAVYRGDSNFSGSTSPAQSVTVRALPPPVRGTINSTMQWTFFFAPGYTRILTFIVNEAPVGARVVVQCQGRGCPFGKRTIAVTKGRRCKATHTCARRTINLVPDFRGHRLRVGTRVTIEIVRPAWIGKYYRFIVRPRRGPRIRIACLAPGASRPGVGC